MSDSKNKKITLVRLADGKWRVFLDEEDLNYSFQFPWDALQCALNGSLTGVPVSAIQTIHLDCSDAPDLDRRAEIKATDARKREILDRLRGLDGDGI